MKQSPEDASITSYFRQYALRHDLDIAAERIELLANLVSWLAPASHQIGLTKYVDPLIMAEQLIAPAILLLNPDLSSHTPFPMLDFGAGSGAIGLSLAALMPLHKMVLADRRRRVIQFLDIAARRYGLSNCELLLVDLGKPTNGLESHFGSVLVRAFGPVDETLAGARAWVKPGGTVALWHQPDASGTPDGLTALRTAETDLPSLMLTLYQRI